MARPSPGPDKKRQRSILDFTRAKPTTTSVKTEPDVIDLTGFTDETVSEFESVKLEFESDISCPICGRSISSWSIEIRTQHVELCLSQSLTTVKEEVTTVKQEVTTVKEEVTETVVKKRKVSESKSDTKNVHMNTAMKEKMRYVNSSIAINDTPTTKVIKPPTNISASRQKKPIPTVKVLQFPVDSSTMYEISVDAFCYSPHPTIDQYFLTHFHSDHYGGITKKWSYERVFKDDTDYENDAKYKRIIYCTVITAKLLTLRFSVDPRFIQPLELDTRYCIKKFERIIKEEEDSKIKNIDSFSGTFISTESTPGLYVTPITANHCPGSAIFLFESIGVDGSIRNTLHCGDFRVNKQILCHPSLLPFSINSKPYENAKILDKVYLDTTYMSPAYNFPKQELVCSTVADLFADLTCDSTGTDSLFSSWFGILKQSRITDFLTKTRTKKKKFLILVGTYLIGKERLAISISKRLKCPIYISNINSRTDKLEILKTYEDAYLDSVLTDDDLGGEEADCVIHLVPMKIVGVINELSNYFNHNKYFEVFERCVGLRPTGWTFSAPSGRNQEVQESIDPNTIQLPQLFNLLKFAPEYSYVDDILPQAPVPKVTNKRKGKPDECLYRIYSVPYSEHSSYRELAYFTIFFNIGRVIPTVNIGNEWSIKRMSEIIKSWETARDVRLRKFAYDDGSNIIQKFEKLTLDDF